MRAARNKQAISLGAGPVSGFVTGRTKTSPSRCLSRPLRPGGEGEVWPIDDPPLPVRHSRFFLLLAYVLGMALLIMLRTLWTTCQLWLGIIAALATLRPLAWHASPLRTSWQRSPLGEDGKRPNAFLERVHEKQIAELKTARKGDAKHWVNGANRMAKLWRCHHLAIARWMAAQDMTWPSVRPLATQSSPSPFSQ